MSIDAIRAINTRKVAVEAERHWWSVRMEVFVQTLDKCGWNKSRAAEELGLSRKGLRNKIQRMELERRGARGAGNGTSAGSNGSGTNRNGLSM